MYYRSRTAYEARSGQKGNGTTKPVEFCENRRVLQEPSSSGCENRRVLQEPSSSGWPSRIQPTVSFPMALVAMLTFCIIIRKRDHQKF